MKNIVIYILAVLAMAACSVQEYAPGDVADGANVYFPSDNPTEYNLEDGDISVDIPVRRIAKDECLTVAIMSDMLEMDEEDRAFFNVPASVTFAEGSAEAKLTIGIDREKLEDGKSYLIGLLINDEDNDTPYGNRILYVSLSPWPWELIEENGGKGKYRDDILTVFEGAVAAEADVLIYRHKTKEGVYMMEEPLGWPLITAAFGMPQEVLSRQFAYTPSNIEIHLDGNDPHKVYIPNQFTGIKENMMYGKFYIASNLDMDGEPPVYGTLKDGVITFPKNGLLLYFEGIDEVGPANVDGMIRILMPGVEAVDYAFSARYAGMKVEADNETATALFDFAYGADVTGISYVIVAGDVTGAAVEYIGKVADGTAENIRTVDDFVAGDKSVTVPEELDRGIYTLIAVPAGKDGMMIADAGVAEQFYFAGTGDAGDISCKLEVLLEKPGLYFDDPADVASYPDYSSLVWEISGQEMKSVKLCVQYSDNLEDVSDDDLKEFFLSTKEYDLSKEDIVKLNKDGKLWLVVPGLDAETSYTVVVYAENQYGRTILKKSSSVSTGAVPYSGELAIGNYDISCLSGEHESKTTIKLSATPDSGTRFLVSNLIDGDHIYWYATYDAVQRTLTLDGATTLFGEGKNMFGQKISMGGVMSAGYSTGVEKPYNSPVVFTVNDSNELCGLNTDINITLVLEGQPFGVWTYSAGETKVGLAGK